MNSTLTAQITHCLFYHWTVTWAVLLAYCADASPLVSSQTRATRQSKTTPAHVQRLLCVYSSQPRYCNWDILSRGQCLLQLVWTTTLTRQAATLAWSIWVCVVLYWIQKHAGKKQEKCMKVHEETAQVQCMRQVCEEITWRQLHEEKCCTNVAKVQKKHRKIAGRPTMNWRRCGVQDMRRRVCQLDCRVIALWAWLLLVSPPATTHDRWPFSLCCLLWTLSICLGQTDESLFCLWQNIVALSKWCECIDGKSCTSIQWWLYLGNKL